MSYNRNNHTVTFRQCLRLIGGKEKYQRKLFALMAAYWIFASFFIYIEFFLFKKPVYCESQFPDISQCCHEGDFSCNSIICKKYHDNIYDHIIPERTLTYKFDLFCEFDFLRVMLKVIMLKLRFSLRLSLLLALLYMEIWQISKEEKQQSIFHGECLHLELSHTQ